MSNHINEVWLEAKYEEYLADGYTPTVALELALRDFNKLENEEKKEDEQILC